MNAASSASPPALCCFHGHRWRRRASFLRQCPDLIHSQSLILHISSSIFRRRRRRHPDPNRDSKPSPSDRKVEISVDVDDISNRASTAVTRFIRSSEAKFQRFLSSGAEAYRDFRTSIRVDPGHRIVFSCRRSSLLFAANLFFWSFAVVVAVRVLVWLGSELGFRSWWGFGDWAVIRRDRSLGGREVVVGRRVKRMEAEKKSLRALVNPLTPPARGNEMRIRENIVGKRVAKQERLPKWWPESALSPVVSVGNLEFQKEADRLVRAIMDNRMSGKDYKDDDIIQLRQICKISGAKVTFETANARDSFYRASIAFVLNTCSRVTQSTSTVQIDGEEVRQFISGLADNIELENIRAARLVCAAVAARTRSCFLQSWALEVQGKRFEALEELSKICRILQTFPPEDGSPEMEMVASGLEKNLRVEQREHLLTLFRGVCGSESQRIAEEALGLMNSSGSEGRDGGSVSRYFN